MLSVPLEYVMPSAQMMSTSGGSKILLYSGAAAAAAVTVVTASFAVRALARFVFTTVSDVRAGCVFAIAAPPRAHFLRRTTPPDQELVPAPAQPQQLQLYVDVGDDVELGSAVAALGVPTSGNDAAPAVVLRRPVPERGVAAPELDACAAYAALHWYRCTGAALPASVTLDKLLPKHMELMRNGAPYMNTMALLQLPAAVDMLVSAVREAATRWTPTVVVAFETRAMTFAAIVSYALRLPYVPARRERDVAAAGVHLVSQTVMNDPSSYRCNEAIRIDQFTFAATDRVLIVDDVMHTGLTVQALVSLVHASGAAVAGVVTLVDVTPGVYRPDNFAALVTIPSLPDEE